MPVGDLAGDQQDAAGWHQTFADDFSTDGTAAATRDGSLPDGKWWGYNAGTPITNSTNGYYDSSKVVTVANGVMTFNLHSEAGKAYAAVESPHLPDQIYGRYDVRYRYEPGSNVAGYKSVWMTWPKSNDENEGEDDFNEYGNSANRLGVEAFFHQACGTESASCQQTSGSYHLDPTDWHTATEIWSSGKVSAYVDGHLLATSGTLVPSTPMHLLLQTEASDYGPQAAPTDVVKIDVDWVTVYAPK